MFLVIINLTGYNSRMSVSIIQISLNHSHYILFTFIVTDDSFKILGDFIFYI